MHTAARWQSVLANRPQAGTAALPWVTMTTTDQPSDSLVGALAKARIPAENHEFIRRITTAIGIADYRAVVRPDKPYVIATRRDGLRDLHIYYGYTAGFSSEHEIAQIPGGGTVRESDKPKGTWWVEHPTNQVRESGKRSLEPGG